jgi:hypothetical protein
MSQYNLELVYRSDLNSIAEGSYLWTDSYNETIIGILSLLYEAVLRKDLNIFEQSVLCVK